MSVWRALCLCLAVVSCQGTPAPPPEFPEGETTLSIPAGQDSVGVSIVRGTQPFAGAILVLPGWKHSRVRALNETVLKDEALKRGYVLVCPEMNRSVYASRYFPETRLRWSPEPGLVWVRDRLIPALQAQQTLLADHNNYLLGLSTGGRGVALIALERPGLFRAGAALSGDFDQTLQPRDRLMAGVYGAFAEYETRWRTVDNPRARAAEWKLPLYLAHGSQDRIVPLFQPQRFYESLRAARPEVEVVLHTPAAGHDYPFWSSQMTDVLNFFDRYRRDP